MKQYIDKDDLLAEIERLKSSLSPNFYEYDYDAAKVELLEKIEKFLNTLEVKEDDKYEIPDIKIQDTIEVLSRMKYINDDLKPIADFIINYASWNLHKDEWNQPVLEVPLFRVLDALVQKGKPYCCG